MTRTVIITFLGVRSKETSYQFEAKQYKGKVFALALRQFVDFDQMLVCATPEAEKEVWPLLQQLKDPRIQKVSIPQARTTDEMWQIFESILPYIQEGDEVIFDITHGLRSLPFLSFLFSAYLQFARQARIKAVYYGALEQPNRDGSTPVIDLSNFVQMLDWLVAADQFIQTGNADRLSNLIHIASKNKAFHKASNQLEKVSRSALWCQPFKLMKEAHALPKALKQMNASMTHIAPPFEILQDRILSTYHQFYADSNDLKGVLKAEYLMIKWYLEKKQIIQAATLAREWLVDVVTWLLGLEWNIEQTLKIDEREKVEIAISGLAKLGSPKNNGETFSFEDLNDYGKLLVNHSTKERLVNLWNLITYLRNLFSHAEHQAERTSLVTLNKKIQQMEQALYEIVEELNILKEEAK